MPTPYPQYLTTKQLDNFFVKLPTTLIKRVENRRSFKEITAPDITIDGDNGDHYQIVKDQFYIYQASVSDDIWVPVDAPIGSSFFITNYVTLTTINVKLMTDLGLVTQFTIAGEAKFLIIKTGTETWRKQEIY